MGTNVWPVDAVGGAPLYSGRIARQTEIAALSGGATPARPLGARSGIRSGSGTIVAATSTTWTIRPHAGILDVQTSVVAGPYAYATDVSVTGSMTAATGAARTDVLWVRLDDPGEGDGSSIPAVVFGYTSSAFAGPPRSMTLATIAVPASGGGSPTVTQVAPWLRTSITMVNNQAERDALTAHDGFYVDRLDLNRLERFDGAVWRPYGVETWQGNESVSIGAAPPAGTTKVRYSGSVSVMVNSTGGFIIAATPSTSIAGGYPGLLNGVVSYSLSPGDNFSNLAMVAPQLASSSLTSIFGVARDPNGAGISSRSIRVSWVAEGW